MSRLALLITGSLSTIAGPGITVAQPDGYTAKREIINGHDPASSPPPSFPEPTHAPAGAPNVLVIMTDDVGFASSSTFGGPIPTPTFDALASQGLRYNRFHTTAICSPTRAALLTGRNPQAVGMGYTANWPTGYEGYNSIIPKSAATLPQILATHGYATAMIGKGHITPEWEMGPNGPFDRWPTGLGFHYFYGFLGADTSAFEPALIENTRPIALPADPAYHLDRDLADHAIAWISEERASEPEKPFFMYYAPGTAHAPNHAPKEWLDRFRGKFDAGWDVMREETVRRQLAMGIIPSGTRDAPRPENLPLWSSLSPEKRRLYARFMEAYAASLAYADYQIGRVLDELSQSGQLENTVVIYIQGDNGASAEGRFDGKLFEQSALYGLAEDPDYVAEHADEIGTRLAYNLNPGGWGWAMNAPFPWAKRYGSHLGGIRNGMVLSWPGHVPDPGGMRSQFLHVSDIMPTVLDIAGIKAPDTFAGVPQQPVTGISAAATIAHSDLPSPRTGQIFAMSENLGIYHDGWFAATTPIASPWERSAPKPTPVDDRKWELYDLDRDFSQSKDLAALHPKRLAALKRLFWQEAQAENILPIHASAGGQGGMPSPNKTRAILSYDRGQTQLAEAVAPDVIGHSFDIEADVALAEAENGVLVAQGGRFGGYALFLDNGRPVFTYNLTPAQVTRVAAPMPIAAGRHKIGLRLELDHEKPGSAATAILEADGVELARGRVPRTFPLVISHSENFDVGQDLVSPVDPSYESADSRFGGTLFRLTFTIKR
ncbi:arylsulfatase [Croceicoccus estronivorus]|uniref:arylsulfatase n=1 Tax=Croceicoccus estronivorus TaxID=1172626 RepID=UPI00082B4983|nr:arylsulfatase [Croceicoccus estronivorus]OCC23531.1 arylsulfatase [Croceicoccus estronivorus]